MTVQTRLSAKGQVVIPKDVRDRLNWGQGQSLDVLETPDGVLLKPHTQKKSRSLAEGLSRIRARANYSGPPVSIADMRDAISDMMRTDR
jgi:AbrB family looped-hinge helix DNA binding protein